jgi:hypothetical protein
MSYDYGLPMPNVPILLADASIAPLPDTTR